MFASLSLKTAFCVSAVRKTTFHARHSFQHVHYDYMLRVIRIPWREKSTDQYSASRGRTEHQYTYNPQEAFGLFKGVATSLSATLKVPVDTIFSVSLSKTSHLAGCKITLSWPNQEQVVFYGSHRRQRQARVEAAIKAMKWLLDNKFLDSRGRPVIQRTEEVIDRTIHLPETVCREIDEVLQSYNEHVLPLVAPLCEEGGYQMHFANHDSHPIFGPRHRWEHIDEEEEKLLLGKNRKNPSFRSQNSYPIESYRMELLEAIENNRVVLVKGETGCGKSTQVPQFILDSERDQGRGSECVIAVAQNRRMPCVALAHHVAKERNEKVGETVGFSIKMDTVHPTPHGGAIMYFTSGKLLHAFRQNPYLDGISHVVLDEIHLRDSMTDSLMYMTKQALRHNTKLRLILMSATVDTSKTYSYFQDVGNVSVHTVPGRTFPVKQNFLEDFIKDVDFNAPQGSLHQVFPLLKQPLGSAELNVDLVVQTVKWIHKTRPQGSILVFVTGWQDMVSIGDRLKIEEGLTIIPVHSRFGANRDAFSSPVKSKRKVIISTNIAETSLTFTDVVYVVDCGLHKVSERDPSKQDVKILKTEIISKANAKQRMGRAGRVQPGESFHLYTREHFEEMEDYEIPQIMRNPLEEVVFMMKLLFPNVKAVKIFKDFPDPPDEEDLLNTVGLLTDLNILTPKSEVPTALAEVLSKISASLPTATALIYSVLLRCMDLTLSVMTLQEQNISLLESKENGNLLSVKKAFDKTSDLLGGGKALDRCIEFVNQGFYENEIAISLGADISCRDVAILQKLRTHLQKQLLSLIREDIVCKNSEELVKGILVACCGSLLVLKNKRKMIDEKGRSAFITSGVNSKLEDNPPSPFIHYQNGNVVRNVALVKDTTLISPLTFVLFSRRGFEVQDFNQHSVLYMKTANHFHVTVRKEDVSRLLNLRAALKDTIQYFVLAELLRRQLNGFETMSEFREQLISCVIRILELENESSNNISKERTLF